jgi:transposase-like protein
MIAIVIQTSMSVNHKSYRAFFNHLKERSLRGILLIISDSCIVLYESMFFPP